MIPSGGNSGDEAKATLLRWFQDLLVLREGAWDRSQVDFLVSLLEGHEGTKTLAELAVTSARIRGSGLKPEELGTLQKMHEAIEVFWVNPCPETYENLRTVGRSLDTAP